jgi:hypothetical protein
MHTYDRSVIVIEREPRLNHRRRSVIIRGVLSLGTATAFALWFVLSSANKPGAILVPAFLASTLVFSIISYNRIGARRRWQAAWESYATVDLSRNSLKSVE